MDDVTRRLSAAERESASRVAAAEEETRVARSALAAMRDANQLEASAAAAAHQKYRRDVSEEDARLRRQIASAIADAEGAAAAAAGARAREEETQSRCVELIEAREEQMRRCRDLAAAELRSAEAAAAEASRALRDEAAEVRRALQDAEAAAAGDRTRADNALEDERRRRVAAEEEAAVRESSSVPFSSIRFSSILFNILLINSNTRTVRGQTMVQRLREIHLTSQGAYPLNCVDSARTGGPCAAGGEKVCATGAAGSRPVTVRGGGLCELNSLGRPRGCERRLVSRSSSTCIRPNNC